MKRKRKVIAPLAVTAVGALAAGVSVLLRKNVAAAPEAKGAKSAPKVIVRDPTVQEYGSYSFISGFQNAATIELTLPFDPGTEFFSVVEEDFLSASDVSHVALLTSEDYRLQIEYAAYYGGEGWEAHVAHLREKHPDLKEVCFGENAGVLFLAGDSLRFDLPVPEDGASYVQITIQKTPSFDGEVTELAQHPALTEQLAGIRFAKS